MEKSCTTRTALALARRPSSKIIRVRVRVLRTLAAATIRGRRLFRSELFDSAATIRGCRLFVWYSNVVCKDSSLNCMAACVHDFYCTGDVIKKSDNEMTEDFRQ